MNIIKNITHYLVPASLVTTIIICASCNDELDLDWPNECLKVVKAEGNNQVAETTTASVDEKITFAKCDELVNNAFSYSLWTGDAGHNYDSAYVGDHRGIPFPGTELTHVYSQPGTYQVVYLITLWDYKKQERERREVIKEITIVE